MTQPPVRGANAPEQGGIYNQMTDGEREKAATALKREPYFSTRPPDPSVQDRIAKETDR